LVIYIYIYILLDEKSSLVDETSDLVDHLFILSDMDMLIVDETQMNYAQIENHSAAYLQDFRSEPCQVCGENASGWHCGSITW